MTSASNHPTAVQAHAAARIGAVADRIATHWGHYGHTALTTMIGRALHRPGRTPAPLESTPTHRNDHRSRRHHHQRTNRAAR